MTENENNVQYFYLLSLRLKKKCTFKDGKSNVQRQKRILWKKKFKKEASSCLLDEKEDRARIH